MHIFKTGGNTFRAVSATNYSRKQLLSGPIQGRFASNRLAKTVDSQDYDVRDMIERVQKGQRSLRAVAANLPWGIHRYLERPVVYISFMREPVSRCRSIWFFAYEHRHDRRMWSVFERYGFDLDRILAAQDETILLQNDQTRMFAGAENIRVGEDEFFRAQDNIEGTFLLAGAMERYDECLGFISAHLHWRHWSYERRNVGGYPGEARLPGGATRRFSEANEWDIKLYAWLMRDYLPRRLSQSVVT